MIRLIDTFFNTWKLSSIRKPLVIRGARQVGKTYSVDQFGCTFSKYIKIDFEETPSMKKLFHGDLDVVQITMQICALQGVQYDPGNTLLFLDEIQECPEALIALRYFYEKLPQLYVIAAGSLLEFSIHNFSFPVGRVSFYWMYPMTFYEFLTAKGLDSIAAYIPGLSKLDVIPDVIHNSLLDNLKEYFLVGGMPEAVQSFLETSSYKDVASIQKSIVLSYIEDITKYYPKTDKNLVTDLLYSCARNVGKQIKYSKLVEGERSDKIKGMLEKLFKVLVVHPVYASNGEHPFKASRNQKYLKIVFLDIGLLQNISGINYEESFLKGDLMAAYEGALAEQFVGQQLLSSHTDSPPELYYWTRQKQGGEAEIDFLLESNPVLPVEVKSDKAGRLRSLHQALLQFTESPYGLVLSTRNIEHLEKQRVLFLPLYSNISTTG
jgi:predicted AAA+ superfamily ATPase